MNGQTVDLGFKNVNHLLIFIIASSLVLNLIMKIISKIQRVKILFLLFLLPFASFNLHAQVTIELSKDMDESRLGYWQKGDFTIYVQMEELEHRYRQTGEGYLNAIKTNGYSDSTNAFYQATADRYLLAADLLKNAEYGFKLNDLILYYGPFDEKQNIGNSTLLEQDVRRIVESGQAVVYNNGSRIYTLKIGYESYGGDFILTQGTQITIYYDTIENYLFKYSQSYGW